MDASKWLFLLAFCSLQIFIGSIANFVVIATIFVSKPLRRTFEDRLILNLAITNFFSLIIVLPCHMYNFNQRKNNMKTSSVICYYTSMVEIFETNAIFCIAVDWFVAVVYPLRHPNIINTHVMTVMLYPFIYGLRTKRFRKEFRKNIWSRCFHRTANETNVPPLSHRT